MNKDPNDNLTKHPLPALGIEAKYRVLPKVYLSTGRPGQRPKKNPPKNRRVLIYYGFNIKLNSSISQFRYFEFAL